MHIAWLGTRAPWPPHDGGRLVAWTTIAALADAGVRITVIAPGQQAHIPDVPGVTWRPVVARRPRWSVAAVDAVRRGLPITIVRHRLDAVADELTALLARDPPDAVHVEQLQAFAASHPAHAAGLPVVLRAHNVEHALWLQGGGRRGLRARVIRAEGHRLRRHEAAVLAQADVVVTLTGTDCHDLRALCPAARIRHVPPAFPDRVIAAPPLEGQPACLYVGSAGWGPNDDARTWLLDAVWPAVRRVCPQATLHLFGTRRRQDEPQPGVHWHDPPVESRSALAAGSVLLLPLRVSSGIRMRVLEAWAAGVPVVATSAAWRGLEVESGVEGLVADDATALADAVRRLHDDPGLSARLAAAGRARLQAAYAPAQAAAALITIYREAIAGRAAALPALRGRVAGAGLGPP